MKCFGISSGVYIINETWRYNIPVFVLKIFHLLAALTCEITLQEKVHISVQPCNMLFSRLKD